MKKKIRALIIAESANPDWTSVPLIGWLHTKALAEICDVHLVTQIRNEKAILRQGWSQGKHFTVIDSERIARPAHILSKILRRGNQLSWSTDTAIQSLIYPYFEYLVWNNFKNRLVEGEFDIVHRITPVSPTAPSFLAGKLKKIGVPLIVGPINGGVPWPKAFSEYRKREKEWLVSFRGLYKILPGYRSLHEKAHSFIVGSLATYQQMPAVSREKSFYIPENGIDKERFYKKNISEGKLPLKVIFVGRLVPYKGVDIALESLQKYIINNKIVFDIYGAGPEESCLAKLTSDLGIKAGVTFHGFVENSDLQEKLATSDLLVFPSVREFGGGVVLECMAMGVVPIVANYGGPSELVDDDCGYRIKLCERQRYIKRIEEIVGEIVDDTSLLKKKKENCLVKIQEQYTWEAKAAKVCSIYHWALGQGKRPKKLRPDFRK